MARASSVRLPSGPTATCSNRRIAFLLVSARIVATLARASSAVIGARRGDMVSNALVISVSPVVGVCPCPCDDIRTSEHARQGIFGPQRKVLFALANKIVLCNRAHMEQLSTYLRESSTTKLALAASVGIAKSTMTELSQGKYPPSLAVAFAIEDATGGAVPARGWLE